MAHREVCVISYCPEKTVARISTADNSRRYDFCLKHSINALYKDGDDVVIQEVWGGFDENDIRMGLKAREEMREHV